MMLMTLSALLAATASPQATLGVTANVIRPVEIVADFAREAEPVMVLRNTSAVDVEVSGASVAQPDADTLVITGKSTAVVAITLTY